MPPTSPDDADEWIDRLQDELNSSEGFARAAAGFDGTFRFEIQPDENYSGDPVPLTLSLEDGTCTDASAGDRAADYDYALRGPYGAWEALLADELDVSAAVMGGTFDLEGPTIRLMQHRAAVGELLDTAQSVEESFDY